MRKAIARLFEQTFQTDPESLVPMASDGSQRTYFRLGGGPRGSVIGAHGPDAEENRAFLSFSRTFRELGLPVPEIYSADEGRRIWLAEDLGDLTLFSALSRARAASGERAHGDDFPPSALALYEKVVEMLPRFQVEGAHAVDFDVAYPRSAFDEQSMRWDLNYFKYHFLKLAHVPFSEQELENDFDRLTRFLLRADGNHFLYRDFQSRNIMLRDEEPWFIDYQGGRRGALQYDIASLLYDAKAAVPELIRQRLLERYLDALGGHHDVDRDRFVELYRGFVLIRIMQAMGAYGYRGFFERKPRFLQSVPYAARNLVGILEGGLPVSLPELEKVFRRIADGWAEEAPPAPTGELSVHIASFSYRHGYPADDRGHGGGFVFDCRSLPNPGRSPEFAELTGLDPAVVTRLEAEPQAGTFWSGVRSLVEAHVESFRARGFTDLTVAFGCTGGQHRSVYFAERLAEHLHQRYGDVEVTVRHLARGQWPERSAAGRGAQPGIGEHESADGSQEPSGPGKGASWTP